MRYSSVNFETELNFQMYDKSQIITIILINSNWLVEFEISATGRQSKDLGLNPSAVESVFFFTERFQIL